MKFDYRNCINKLQSIGERQLEAEVRAREFIEKILHEHRVDFFIDEYLTFVPKYKDSRLVADGKVIECLPCGFISGSITNADSVLSSLISSQKNFYDANINFNPRCSVISRSNHYFSPALAISKKDVQKVLKAKKIDGVCDVIKTAHTSANILVGNLDKPEKIIICHYDSISCGAVDNASGVALTIKLIVEQPDFLEGTMFAICGNEELSYDEPVYWGHGYRVLESNFTDQFEVAQEIIVLDSFGHTKPEVITDSAILKLAFPTEASRQYKEKVSLISGGYDELMKFYHAENDTAEKISEEYFLQAERLLI